MTTKDGTVGRYLGWLLVALSLAAGVIHFAVSGGHFDQGWWHGMFFTVVAWAQLSWAAFMIVRPDKRLLLAGVVGNALVMATWAMSRIWGVPVGPDAWESEPVTLADGLATGFEAGIVMLSLAVLIRPTLAQRALRPTVGLAGLGTAGLAIAVVSTLALSPSFASEHHGDGGESAGHANMEGHADGAEAAEHANIEGHTNTVIAADGSSNCEKSGVASEGNSGHGHRGPAPDAPMDDETRAEFRRQTAQSQEVTLAHPTVADAEADGWHLITPYVPCIAAHYISYEAMQNGFDPAQPEILLYAGTEPDSEIVGLSYLYRGGEEAPEGFAGELDTWHIHEQLCIGQTVLGDENISEEECEERGGQIVPLGDLWMNHMWNAPGWPSRWGLFSSEHPDLGGRIGDINAPPDPDGQADLASGSED